jgi:hypothetical protein
MMNALSGFQGDGLGRAGLSRKIRAPQEAKQATTLESSNSHDETEWAAPPKMHDAAH